jgi:hypothetical protein
VNHRDWALGEAVWIITNTTIMTPLGDACTHIFCSSSLSGLQGLAIKTERKTGNDTYNHFLARSSDCWARVWKGMERADRAYAIEYERGRSGI